ncbi:MAG TPA: hypothetical protein VLX29_02765, partial [Nitrospirota bacterium]|nr:hypothetical protein [Nitrospirota bacterium]
MAIDRTTEVAGVLNHMWLALFSEDRYKEQLGLKYISHTWDGHSSWYLWLDGCRGVYELELHGAQKLEGYDWLAEFVIKYYPCKEEDTYKKLSKLEQICRESEAFANHPAEGPPDCSCHGLSSEAKSSRFDDLSHGTGIPSYRYNDVIPPDFFYAGKLVLALKSDGGSFVKLKTQTSWHVTMMHDYKVLDSQGNVLAMLHKGEVDRDYPGFSLCNFFFERFTKGWALFYGYTVKDQ